MVDRFQHLFDSLTEEVVVIDRDLRITYANPAWIQRTGFDLPQVLGHRCHEVLQKTDTVCLEPPPQASAQITCGAQTACAIRKVFESGQPLQLTCWGYAQVLSTPQVRLSASPAPDASGQIDEAVLIFYPQDTKDPRSDQIGLLADISRHILSILDPQALLDYAVHAIQQQFGYYHADVFLTDPAGEQIVFRASSHRTLARQWREQGLRYRIGEEGITGHVAATGQPYLCNDVQQDPFYVSDSLLSETKSELTVPIKAGTRVIGVLDLNSDRAEAFDQDDLFVAQSLGDQLALGLENARLFEQAQAAAAAEERSRLQLKSIQVAAASLSAELDPDTLLNRIVTEAAKAFQAEAVSLMLWDEEEVSLIVRAAYGLSEGYARQQRIPRERIQQVTNADRSAPPVYIQELAGQPFGDKALVEQEGLRSLLAIPMVAHGQIIGALNIYSKGHARTFGPAEIELGEAFAAQAGIMIVNTQLYQQTEIYASELSQRAERLALVNRISMAVSSTLDLDQSLQIAAREMAKAFDVKQAGIILFDTQANYGRVAAEYQATPDDTAVQVRIPLKDNPSLARVMATKKPLAIANARNDPLTAPIREAIEIRNIESILIVPLVVKGDVIGTIGLDAVGEPRIFSPDEMDLAQTIANQIAIAIENAQLFAAEARQRREAETLQAATRALGATLDLQEIFELILSELRQVVPYDSASVQQLEGNELRIIGGYGFPNLEELLGVGFDLTLADNPNQQVVSTRAPVILEDAPQRYEAFKQDPHTELGIRSWLGVPILFGDRLTGMLALDKREPGFYTPEHARLVMAFAIQAAIAIENARLYQEMNRHLEEVQILNRVSQAATSTLNFDQVIRRGMTALLGMRNFERVNILLLDEEREELWLHPAIADSDLFPQRADFRIPVGQGVTGWVAKTGQVLRTGDIRQDPRYIAGYVDSLSELCVPLRVGEQIIGVLDVQSTKPNAFSESDERLLSTLSGQLSTLLENSRLFAEAQLRVRELTSLMQVSQAIDEARELDAILDIVLEEVFTLIASDEGSVLLIDPPNSNHLRMVAERGLGREVMEAFNTRPVYTHEGTYRRTLRTGQIVEVADTTDDPDFLDDVGSRAKRITNIPLLTERGAIGLIAVDGLPRDDTSRRLLTTLASMAAVAIDKERLHLETANRLAEVSTLYTLATQITSSLSRASVLDSIVTILRMTLDCRACSIFLVGPTEEYLQLESGSGPSAAWKGIARLKIGEGISGRVITERRTIYVPDTQLEPDFLYFDPEIRSLVVVPLLVRDKAIGTLSIDDTKPNAFDDEVRLLTIAAAQAAVAIENAQLYESLQASYENLEHAYEELRHLDKMKSELIQNISHELRTPLTFIKGYVELLQDGEMGELQEEQQGALEIVANKAEVLSRLVDDIISMQQVGRQQINAEPISLTSLGHTALRAALVSAQEADLTLVDEIPDGLPLVMGDLRRLGQVLDNLLQNAIKFSHPGGSITIRMREEGLGIRTEVQDTGIGIPADQLPRVFDRFYQVDGTTTRRFGGTGLGLAIVKQIVEAHNGEVGVESEERQGSLFYFIIPKANAERE